MELLKIMMVGIDVMDVARMEKLADKPEHIKRIYTPYEIGYINKTNSRTQRMAGIFCAKEAFLKALGIGVRNGIDLLEVEVRHEESGKPYLQLSDKVRIKLATKNAKNVAISISHTSEISTAICVIS